MSYLELVALIFKAEFMSIDNKNSLFKDINRKEICNLCVF